MGSGQRKMRGMEFVCDQEWDDMKPIDGGRFCGQCQQPVIDFTGWSRDELVTYFKTKPFTCGQYEPHQVDPTLIPVENLGRGVRRGLFASIAALGLHAASAQTVRDPQNTEQVIYDPTVNDATEGTCPRPGRSARAHKEEDSKAWVMEKRCRARKRVYVSASWPFLHIRSRYVKGRRARVCKW